MSSVLSHVYNLRETGVGLVGVQDELVQGIQGVQDELAWSQGAQPRCSGGSDEPPKNPLPFSPCYGYTCMYSLVLASRV
jgi:hypothetical protein